MEEVWAERFNGEIDDLFGTQDRISAAVLGTLVPGVLTAEVARAADASEQADGAYESVLRAIPLTWSSVRSDNPEALRHLARALELDPGYPLAHALMSWCYSQQVTYVWTDRPDDARSRALEHARKALKLAPNDNIVLTFVASAESSFGDVAAAEHHVSKALEIDPTLPWAHARLGYVRLFQGRPDEAIAAFERALDLGPHDPMRHNVYFGLGASRFALEDHTGALRWLEQALIDNPDMIWVNRLLAACRALSGDLDGARRAVSVVKSYAPDADVDSLVKAVPVTDPDFRARLLKAYKAAGF